MLLFFIFRPKLRLKTVCREKMTFESLNKGVTVRQKRTSSANVRTHIVFLFHE